MTDKIEQKVGLTRRAHNGFLDFKRKLKTGKLLRIWGYFVFIVALVVILLWLYGFSVSTAIGTVALVIIILSDVIFGLAYFLPVITFYLLFWATISIASLLDLVLYTVYLTQWQNRIALKVAGVNSIIAIVAFVYFARIMT
ncbi:MAG: hypothetical protein JXR76_19340 [Deltaproteobacteria bacterium]|nr:hypothetical protein [Deltaproteobacteria bacterium]